MSQSTVLRPITWSGDVRPHSLWGGGRDFVNVSYYHDVYFLIPQGAAFIGARGVGTDNPPGLFFTLDAAGNWNVTTSMSGITGGSSLAAGKLPGISAGQWYTLRLDVNGTIANGWVNGVVAFSNLDVQSVPASGHIREWQCRRSGLLGDGGGGCLLTCLPAGRPWLPLSARQSGWLVHGHSGWDQACDS